jgi:hypothetical protein
MEGARCTLGRHLGEDAEGRCSFCGDRVERPNVLLTVLMFVAVVLTVVMTLGALLSWWLVS